MLQLEEGFDIEEFSGHEFYSHPAMAKLPRMIYLPMNTALDAIGICNASYLRMEDQGTPEFLLDELIILLCRNNVDFEDGEYKMTVSRFRARGVTDISYDRYKVALLNTLSGFYQRLCSYVEAWREFAGVELSGIVRYDLKAVVIKFNVNPSGVEIDQLINQWVNTQIENNQFVPYRYMRLLGRM